jgi:methionine-rich copper-binding protein CopC
MVTMLPSNSPVRRARIVAASAVLLLGLGAARMPFHLHLVKSLPAANATVGSVPDSIRLWFSQRPELAVTSVKVTGPGETAVALAPLAQGDSAAVIAPLKAKGTAAGSYTVAWRTMSKDGHVVRGTFSFRVQPAAR